MTQKCDASDVSMMSSLRCVDVCFLLPLSPQVIVRQLKTGDGRDVREEKDELSDDD